MVIKYEKNSVSEQIDLDNIITLIERYVMNWVEYLSDVKFKTQLDKTNLAPITKQCFI